MNFNQSEGVFLELTPTTKPMNSGKQCLPLDCALFGLRSLVPFERCVLFWLARQFKPPEMANELKIEMTPFIWVKGKDVPFICGADF